MKWLELSVVVPAEFVEPVSHLFTSHGQGLVIEELSNGEVCLATYLPHPSIQSRGFIDIGIRLISTIKPLTALKERVLEDEEWEKAWKSHFSLLRIGRQLVIKPTWIDYTPLAHEKVIELDPGMAFGTGHHPSTRMCLELLQQYINDGPVLDLGIGSGILSIAALKLGASSIIGLDVDSTSIKAARLNLAINGLDGNAQLILGTLPNVEVDANSIQLAVANITAHAIQQLVFEIGRALKSEGYFIASGILDIQKEQLERHLHNNGFEPVAALAVDDWRALVLRLKNI